jgi:hypothetical protein
MSTRNKDYEVDGEPTVEKMWAINEMLRTLFEEVFSTRNAADDAAEDAAEKVEGPASSTDNAIARWDGTDGATLQNSGATIDDSGNLTANNFSGTHSGTSSGTNSGDVTLVTTAAAFLSIVGQVITTALINVGTMVTGRLAYANLTAATAASKLLGRQSGSAGDWQEITLGTNLTMTGTTLDATGGGETHEDGYWSPLTDGDTTQPELIFDSNGDAIMMWVATP